MLELWEPKGALEELERYLDAELRPGLAADVFLGYRLGEPLRRSSWPAPPEPCPLPCVAARIVERVSDTIAAPLSVGEWVPSWPAEDYAAAVDEVRAAIARGDVYQVNLVQYLSAPYEGDPRGLVLALAPLKPLHTRALSGDGWTIISASPELFLERRGDVLRTKPIKGTRPAGEPVDSDKDRAEHVMIVDLERNDLSRVCDIGSIRWPELLQPHELAGVSHLVSTVEGRLRRDAGLAEVLAATFPGGSVTGAPKIAALDEIARLEPVGRGASMGALGTVWPNGDFSFALTIRTFAAAAGRLHLWAGGGIVWDSDPDGEIEESWVKARPLLDAIGAPVLA